MLVTKKFLDDRLDQNDRWWRTELNRVERIVAANEASLANLRTEMQEEVAGLRNSYSESLRIYSQLAESLHNAGRNVHRLQRQMAALLEHLGIEFVEAPARTVVVRKKVKRG